MVAEYMQFIAWVGYSPSFLVSFMLRSEVYFAGTRRGLGVRIGDMRTVFSIGLIGDIM